MHAVEKALKALKEGKFVLVFDDTARENEGDLVLAAEMATKETIAFMIKHTSGILCCPMITSHLKRLHLPQMVVNNTESHLTAFTVSVDVAQGTSTGVSAADRAKTIRALASPLSQPEDFRRPGHIFPLEYKEGGVLKRQGHTEAAIDLLKIASLHPVAVIGEVTNEDGSMARTLDLQKFAKEHDIPFLSIADIVKYRREREKLIEKIAESILPLKYGKFKAFVYKSVLDNVEHMALVLGEISSETPTLVRVHSECLTGDILGSLRCDCGDQLHLALKKISEEGKGILVYLRGHEGRGIGLGHKLRAYNLQDQGADTVEANLQLGFPPDKREYGIGAQILADLNVKELRLMTNNPAKYSGLSGFNLEIVERVPLTTEVTPENEKYLSTKKEKMGHLLEI